MPGHLLLYHPGVQTLKELVDSGELGDVLYVYGQRVRTSASSGPFENALWSLGVHDLSVILYLLDEEPHEAVAEGRAFLQPGVEDVVFCTLRFPSGKIAHMHLSWLDPHKLRKMTVVGTEKQVVFDDMEPEWKLTLYENAARSGSRATGRRLRETSRSQRWRWTSRCDSSASTSSRSSAARATGGRSRATARWSSARSSG